jgi:hypothetical protein
VLNTNPQINVVENNGHNAESTEQINALHALFGVLSRDKGPWK